MVARGQMDVRARAVEAYQTLYESRKTEWKSGSSGEASV